MIRVPKVLADKLLKMAHQMAHQMDQDSTLRFCREGESIVSDQYVKSLEQSRARARRLEILIAEANGGIVPDF